ncbi:MAG: hypothetical protein J6X44_10795 [Thermoguttaceae bacterium]|nr:hypothetical protein [Thermoguttaceae bacterium]
MRRLFVFLATPVLLLSAFFTANADEPQTQIDLGAKRELFLGDYLVGSLDSVELKIHQPERKNLINIFDKPWEGDGDGYFTILKIDDKYMMYYRAWGVRDDPPMSFACLESKDGIEWTRPVYGLCEYEGSKENNILIRYADDSKLGTHDLTPFLDLRPGCPADEKYKTVGYGGWYAPEEKDKHGVYAWKSADGIHWSMMQTAPVYSDGRFDTQNCAFWSTSENKYVLYYREFRNDIRVVDRAVSDDFIHWTKEGEIEFPEGQGPTLREQLYTNQIQPYYRAPQIYIGTPARYVDNGMTATTQLLPEWEERQDRMTWFKGGERLGTAVTDSILIYSRDGKHFNKADEPFIAPGLRVKDNWTYGDNYLAWNIVETPSADADSPNELSIYATESSGTHGDVYVRRYALRIDGFGSLHAKAKEGVAVTKPLTFDGKELSLNVGTSAAGYVRVEVLDETDQVIPGFSTEDCDLISGDFLDYRVTWKKNADMSALAGKTIKLRFVMKEADVYSLKWE